MRKINSAVFPGLRGYLFAFMFMGFFLFGTGGADAQQNLLFDHTFTVKRDYRFGVTYYDGRFSSKYFTYKNVQYEVHGVSDGKGKVGINIKPDFPPYGEKESDFALHTGSAEQPDKLNTFNFRDAVYNEWAGESGWRRKSKGIVRITVVDTSAGDHLRFAETRPVPRNNSGRLEFIKDPNDDSSDKWRVCNRGFGKEEAEVACRQLGLPTAGAKVLDLNDTDWLDVKREGFDAWLDLFEIIDITTTKALLDGLGCKGSEKKLVECGHSGIGVVSGGSCPIENTVGVSCGN